MLWYSPSNYKGHCVSLQIHYKGHTDPDFDGWWFLFTSDGNTIYRWMIKPDENGNFEGGVSAFPAVSDSWYNESHVGRVEVYKRQDVNVANSVDGGLQDRSKAILVKKVNIDPYTSKEETHVVEINDGKFSPNQITINLGDRIKFDTDCSDCYQLQFVQVAGKTSDIGGLGDSVYGNSYLLCFPTYIFVKI